MEAEQVIEYQRAALLRLLTGLFVVAGMTPGDASVASLPKPVRLLILRVLLPAESATRRLAMYLSRRLKPAPERKRTGGKKGANRSGKTGAPQKRAAVFRLFDRRKFIPELSDGKRVARGPGPSVRFFDEPPRGANAGDEVAAPTDAERQAAAAQRLCRRMEALFRALSDMPALARRMQRAMNRRASAPPGPGRYGPVRSGLPPGYRRSRTHEVDELLYECHLMVWLDRPAPDD